MDWTDRMRVKAVVILDFNCSVLLDVSTGDRLLKRDLRFVIKAAADRDWSSRDDKHSLKHPWTHHCVKPHRSCCASSPAAGTKKKRISPPLFFFLCKSWAKLKQRPTHRAVSWEPEAKWLRRTQWWQGSSHSGTIHCRERHKDTKIKCIDFQLLILSTSLNLTYVKHLHCVRYWSREIYSFAEYTSSHSQLNRQIKVSGCQDIEYIHGGKK